MVYDRIYNFSAGPSMLPVEVLESARDNMLNYEGSGMSVMEMSHRSSAFEPIIEHAEAQIRKLMNVPSNYKVLFVQGGGSTQFAMVAQNLGINRKKAAYIETGVWAKKAAAEAKHLGVEVDVIASSKDKNYSYIPRVEKVSGDYDYVYVCFNNTIMGTHYEYIPETGDIPLVADMSSCILSEEIDVSKFGLIFAGAQKNLAPAGVTLVIVREDLIPEPEKCLPGTPTMSMYKTHSENGSMYNTPPCYTIYVLDKVLNWIEKNGGAKGINKLNVEKAEYLYNYLDNSEFYHATTEKGSRSLMNVPFLTKYSDNDGSEEAQAKEKAINSKFVKEAEAAGLVNLKGHRLVGGMRASIYNAMTMDGVKALVKFMEEFAKNN